MAEYALQEWEILTNYFPKDDVDFFFYMVKIQEESGDSGVIHPDLLDPAKDQRWCDLAQVFDLHYLKHTFKGNEKACFNLVSSK